MSGFWHPFKDDYDPPMGALDYEDTNLVDRHNDEEKLSIFDKEEKKDDTKDKT